jgi:hypothetical protein
LTFKPAAFNTSGSHINEFAIGFFPVAEQFLRYD